MYTEIGEQIRITYPTQEVIDWCRDNLELPNPDFIKNQRMGFWNGSTPVKIYLYELDGNTIVIPFGCLRSLMKYLTLDTKQTFVPAEKVDFEGEVPLFDYQKTAVEEMYHNHYGILQSPAGSGKTQMGIALAVKFSERTLWLTHTKDLLKQSLERAKQYFPAYKLGTITEGMVNIGETITFATVQTMSNLDLQKYRDIWDVIIVDECHHVAGTPTKLTMFSRILNNLRARHKYGLSATVHRADGMIKATYAYLGNVVYVVPDSAVENRIMTVTVKSINCFTGVSMKYVKPDGMIDYQKLINYLCEDEGRNRQIMDYLCENRNHSVLILSERVNHLENLYNRLPWRLQSLASVIDGKTKKNVREKAIEDMRTGEKRFLFATYQLAKEGLDIPRLDRLFLTTPQKDYAVVTQAVGRVARVFEGKETPIVYDFVDSGIRYLADSYNLRCRWYRKLKCEME